MSQKENQNITKNTIEDIWYNLPGGAHGFFRDRKLQYHMIESSISDSEHKGYHKADIIN